MPKSTSRVKGLIDDDIPSINPVSAAALAAANNSGAAFVLRALPPRPIQHEKMFASLHLPPDDVDRFVESLAKVRSARPVRA
jgi:hypothetical protein